MQYKKTEPQLFHKHFLKHCRKMYRNHGVFGRGQRGVSSAEQGCWMAPTCCQRQQISSGTQQQPGQISRSDPRSLWCPTAGGCWLSHRTRSHLSAPWPWENKKMFQQLDSKWQLLLFLSSPSCSPDCPAENATTHREFNSRARKGEERINEDFQILKEFYQGRNLIEPMVITALIEGLWCVLEQAPHSCSSLTNTLGTSRLSPGSESLHWSRNIISGGKRRELGAGVKSHC